MTGLLSFPLGNDFRKFIKRKHSDAGQAGRSWEELKGTISSELRTSEGAKRLQQRFCGPVVAMSFNFIVSIGIILGNKLVMGKVGFKFPILLTIIHYTFAWFLLAILKTFSLLPIPPPTKTTPFSSLLSLGVVMAFASGLANTSLKHNSVGFYQMAKIAVTPTIVLAEFVLFTKTISFSKIVALVAVSVGVAVATVTDLEFNLFGACIAIAWIIPSAINKILKSNMQQQGDWTALALMWKTTPIAVFLLVALRPLLDPPGVASFKWDLNNSSAIAFSALLGFLLQLSGALALGKSLLILHLTTIFVGKVVKEVYFYTCSATSATAHVVLGQFKTCVILLGGYLLFDSGPRFVSICGAITALGGMTVYTSLSLTNLGEFKSEINPNQSLSSFVKPKSTHDSERDDITNVV